jgi:NADH-quinone oxidoreductase subunit J
MAHAGLYTAAIVALAGAGGAVLAARPSRSVLGLAVMLCGLAALYGVLDAPFLATLQVSLGLGATVVPLVCVLLLAQFAPDVAVRLRYIALSKAAGIAATVYVTAVGLWAAPWGLGSGRSLDGSVRHIGVLLLRDGLLAVEALGLLLLVAIIGAVLWAPARPEP